ncbi:hypothetical protein M0813_04988 [Anaeramoeba flamelloides]|uniref:Uncharacterized protein n=1 Tax=Anaeramoeba flamelloides TaxID=1746091 RepID=A0ABQ8XIM2_9EUKA|nr:hypothetical protein M0813_04988 [Anaeramoeba flamelloides]
MNRLPIKKINKKIRNNSTVPNFQKNRPQLNAFIQIPELQCTKKQNIIKKINNKIQKSAMVPKMKRTYTTGSQHLSIKNHLTSQTRFLKQNLSILLGRL